MEEFILTEEGMLQVIYAQPVTVYDHSKLNRSADSCKRELCEAQAKKLVGWLDDYLYRNSEGNWILYDDDWKRLQKAVGK